MFGSSKKSNKENNDTKKQETDEIIHGDELFKIMKRGYFNLHRCQMDKFDKQMQGYEQYIKKCITNEISKNVTRLPFVSYNSRTGKQLMQIRNKIVMFHEIQEFREYYSKHYTTREPEFYNLYMSYANGLLDKMYDRLTLWFREHGYRVYISYRYTHQSPRITIYYGTCFKLKSLVKTFIILNRTYNDMVSEKYKPGSKEYLKCKNDFENS